MSCISALVERIESAKRLIHEQDLRLDGERTRQAHALPLSSGKLMGIALRERCGIEPNQLQ